MLISDWPFASAWYAMPVSVDAWQCRALAVTMCSIWLTFGL